jgi:hypothetical protein
LLSGLITALTHHHERRAEARSTVVGTQVVCIMRANLFTKHVSAGGPTVNSSKKADRSSGTSMIEHRVGSV